MGREFLDLFDDWADSYEDSVAGVDPQYRAVFKNYDIILSEVAKCAFGNTLEFGVGTGNLTKKLLDSGCQVTGIEPSSAMREKASAKLPSLSLVEGDFIDYPTPVEPVHTIASSFAFHHLTDIEKNEAVMQYAELLQPMGKIVFADTVFETDEHKERAIHKARNQGFTDLVEDLQREYYTTLPEMRRIFTANGFHVTFEQMNDFAWLIMAVKK
ncbi:class I SAM-dependent methyltransferase [Lentibacillus sp. CBA3610]|uniref:class I SAM-dependent DNA methyltransferase n=1 Tax=Lentibacillus sp. CBA3610 TaxID=2518176 RepID=UPI0015953ADC|nr:class I SAM-dependent methyltransferase [Lentibacillus sp. CBA3610]QKY68480.1 class I SAM-dependent methyltransferase [Lentibacillus sp. CBA3610]